MPAVMRVLVIGGTEFISLHLVRALLARGHEVAVLNRGRRGERLPAGVSAPPKNFRPRSTRHVYFGVDGAPYGPAAVGPGHQGIGSRPLIRWRPPRRWSCA